MAATDCKGMLRRYYRRVPFADVVAWLRDELHETGTSCMRAREISFERAHSSGTTRYERYHYFCDARELRAAIVEQCPLKVDIGAVYERARYAKSASSALPPVHTRYRELLFDIDMDAYDDERTCCAGAECCSTCWPLCAAAAVALDGVLRTHFQYRRITWVYSGRRGVHCWVGDDAARRLSKPARVRLLKLVRTHYDKQRRIRLDTAVTSEPRHLGKMPLCVHPATGRVCVPIEHLGTFDPNTAPTVEQCLADRSILRNAGALLRRCANGEHCAATAPE